MIYENINHDVNLCQTTPRDGRTYDEVLSWCCDNCEGDYSLTHTYHGEFELESDAFAFIMRWA